MGACLGNAAALNSGIRTTRQCGGGRETTHAWRTDDRGGRHFLLFDSWVLGVVSVGSVCSMCLLACGRRRGEVRSSKSQGRAEAKKDERER